MTPACKLLDQQRIHYTLHTYTHDPDQTHFGKEAVEKLALSAQEVFKTLILTDQQHYVVAVVPVACQLDLKKAAKLLHYKRLMLATQHNAERITGYLLGAISPLAQKKRLPTLIDASAAQLGMMYISAGKRGLDIALAPNDLVQLLDARFVEITADAD